VARRKMVTAAAWAGSLWVAIFLCGCTDFRPLGTVNTDAGTDAGGGAPIQVLVWNTALTYVHAARAQAIPLLQARELTDNMRFDTTYAHTGPDVDNGPTDTTVDAYVFTDQGLDKYDVVLFLDTTGNTLDDEKKTVRRQALQDFIEKKGRGFVGTHSATDTYQADAADPWSWYVDFIGTNYARPHSPSGTPGVARYHMDFTHPILAAANTPNPWPRTEEWFAFTRDPLFSPVSGVTMLLTCHDQVNATERPSAWIHEMPAQAGAPRRGRMFYTAFGHLTSAFEEPAVMDLIIAGIKWAAGRL
jgi:type 1 glutamine amidotransferase